MIPLVDAHAHLGTPEELEARKAAGVVTLMCGTEPESAAKVTQLASAALIPHCALHPWHAEECLLADMLEYMDMCPVVGEIGLDSVWTETDMEAQRRVFRAQLDWAERRRKPVVLHTKGMEREIVWTLGRYTVRKLVHWYSCDQYLDEYIAQDCYFTVGPDCERSEAVRAVIARAPIERLLTETDGMSAVAWALERDVAPGELSSVLEGEMREIASIKDLSLEHVRESVWVNFNRFVWG